MKRKISAETKDKAIAMYSQGAKLREIEKKLGVLGTNVSRWAQAQGLRKNRPSPRAHRKLLVQARTDELTAVQTLDLIRKSLRRSGIAPRKTIEVVTALLELGA